ncbi:unnamed protein product [Rotaria magnacalcarata]|uniref:Transmembrane protein n=2 Tax=Rotaria magnacalcarata TaxID=392030 RepID=A0A816U346_9BILA|nr:unnamed protein product [Rotaria magnacalcarata]CAF1682991.1 unnamed protein product [Rotaria magnacalcarata]CAF2105803.1 unnamed protein product [Rotaria magnacalcarata]CAF3768763.1 unnamed protein product [Rotaria magnacalcarata]
MSTISFNSFFDSNTLRRLSVRLILIGFAMFMMCSIMCVTQNYYVLTYCCGILAITIEGSVSLYYQFRGEWIEFKWFSPSIILFIVTCVPTLKILKQHQLHVSQIFKQTNIELLLKRDMTYCFNITSEYKFTGSTKTKYPIYAFKCSKDELINFNKDNFKLMCSLLTKIQYRQCESYKKCQIDPKLFILWSFMKDACTSWRELINHFTLIGILSDELAGFMLIEQLLLLVLVLVNWIWPQTESSEEIYFVQMLRQYLAAAPDIVEFYGNFHQGENLNKLQDRNNLQAAIFIIFIMSTFQFSINLQMKIKPTKSLHRKTFLQINMKNKCLVLFELIFCTSMWSVIYITMTQDLPFLIIRWYFLTFMSDSSSKMVFFLMKNALTIMISFHSGLNDIIDFKENIQNTRRKNN